MLGKIYQEGAEAIIFSPIIKTSKSGMFGNKRLAVLALKQAILGYLSKVPDNLETYQDEECLKNCKQQLHLKSLVNFTFNFKQDKAIIIFRWNQQQQWEFKFDSEEVATIWYNYIYQIIYPPQDKVKVSINQIEKKQQIQLQKPQQSRFKQFEEVRSPKNNEIKIQAQNVDVISKKQRNYEINQFQYRFKDNPPAHQDENDISPVITTFRQKFGNHTIFNSIKNTDFSTLSPGQNWNLIWFEAIETQQQERRIDIHNHFLQICQSTCQEIIKQLTVVKKNRKYAPERVSINQQTYNHEGISFRLIMRRDICQDQNIDYSNSTRREMKKLLENYTFVLKATRNKGIFKVPLAGMVEYLGFSFFCEANLPSNYFQVQPSSRYIFQTQIHRLQQQLKLRINVFDFTFYTNKLAAITDQSKFKKIFLIIKDPKNILPEFQSSEIDNTYIISKQLFLQSNQILSFDQSEDTYSKIKEKSISVFFKNQNQNCTIISYEDLCQSLQLNYISYNILFQLINKSNNRYLNKILATQILSEIFCNVVRTQVVIFVKNWTSNFQHLLNNETPSYQSLIYEFIGIFLSNSISNHSQIWDIVTNELFIRFSYVIKLQDIILGYLLTSIGLKLGINFDYQILKQSKDNFFSPDLKISPKIILSYEVVNISYSKSDLCESYENLINDINQNSNDKTLENVSQFFNLKNVKAEVEPYLWKKICRLFSYYVPYDQQSQYQHLQIYSSLSLYYLDYNVFSILVSAVKWLLHKKKVEESGELINFFKEIASYWISQNNPFVIIFYQILSEYNKLTNNSKKAIYYCNMIIQQIQNLYINRGQLQCLDKKYQLAKLLQLSNCHKESLAKYLQVKKILQRYNKQPLTLLDVMVQISVLYLHLSDIQSCIRYCKSAIQFSILNAFKDQNQQFLIYSLIIRAFEIIGEMHKYKFYVDIIQDKFRSTNNPFILQNVLKVTLQQILKSYSKYFLKKFGYIVYIFQCRKTEDQNERSIIELYKHLISNIGQHFPCQILRKCMENSADISDQIIYRQVDSLKHNLRADLAQWQQSLEVICDFIGYEFIVGSIITNISKSQFL